MAATFGVNGHLPTQVTEPAKPSLPTRPEDSDPVTRTHLVKVDDTSSHDVTTLDGHTVTVHKEETEKGTLDGSFDDRVMALIESFDADRQRKEDVRANHRNLNRVITLIFTLLAGLLITFGLYHGWFGAWGPSVGPYSFVITVAGDTILTAYAYWKKF